MWHEIIAVFEVAECKNKIKEIETEMEENIAAYRAEKQKEIDELKQKIAHNEMLCTRY